MYLLMQTGLESTYIYYPVCRKGFSDNDKALNANIC